MSSVFQLSTRNVSFHFNDEQIRQHTQAKTHTTTNHSRWNDALPGSKNWGINQIPRLQPCKTARKTSPYVDFTGSTSRFSEEPLDQVFA
jgi:hypothetical protein